MPAKSDCRHESLGGSGGSVPDAFPVFVDSKPSLLPFGDLPWEKFEDLVLETVRRVEDVVEIRPYGLRGQGQHGIDLIARTPAMEWHAFQTRRVKRFGLSALRGIVDPFIAGPRPFNARRLVIVAACTRISAKVQDAIYDYNRTHPELEFDQVWDAWELSCKLQRLPLIVARYFGEPAALRFCDKDTLVDLKARPGRPVPEVRNPFALEVHESISPPSTALPVPQLPVYVSRQHDAELEKVVDRALEGESVLAVLLGNSSTGKTRSAWEQVQRLPDEWWLWHPASPEELLEKLRVIAPRTVVWLNELHRYLCTDDVRRDETIAARILESLQDSGRAPVLVLGTLWHEYRLQMTPAESHSDLRPQVRALVSGHFIPVPETFTGAELRQLSIAAEQDPRLAEAQAKAEQGHIAQYLAGGPAQIERYRTADPAAQAVLHAAMDARRLGWGRALPALFLKEAAQAYLTELQQDSLPADWFDRAVSYLLPLCRGARGPLSRIRTTASATAEDSYRLADYLEQHGKRTRSQFCPPERFWLAALGDNVASGDKAVLARAAYARDRTEIAHTLAQAAQAGGDVSGIAAFAAVISQEEGREAAMPYYRFAADNGHAWSRVVVGAWHEDKGEWETAEAWYAMAYDEENPHALVGLAALQPHLGKPDKAEQLYERALAAGGAKAVEYQARQLAGEGEHDLALYLAERSFEHGNLEALTGLAWEYIYTDADRAFAVMEHALKLGYPNAITELMIISTTVNNPDLTLSYCSLAEQVGSPNALRVAGTIHSSNGDERRAAALLWRAFNGGLHWALFELGELRENQGRTRSARNIYWRLAKAGQSYALVKLAALYELAGDCATAEQMAGLYDRISLPIGDNSGWREIARVRHERGEIAGSEALLLRLVEEGDSHALLCIADLRLKSGDKPGAKDILRRAIDSGVSTAKASLARIEEEPGSDSTAA